MLFLYFALSLVGVILAFWLVNTLIPMAESIKKIVNVVLALILVGMCLWLINTYIPMAESIKAILNFVVVVGTCVLVLQALGLWGDVVGMWNRVKRRFAAKREPETHHDSEVGTPQRS
jgi:hypothetical protein